MPTNTLITPSVVRVREDVEDTIYNFNPSDAPLSRHKLGFESRQGH